MRKIGKIVESMETCQRGPRQGLRFLQKPRELQFLQKNWKNRRVDEYMSTRAPTRSAISAKTAIFANIVKSAKNWKIRRVSEKLSNGRLRGLQ